MKITGQFGPIDYIVVGFPGNKFRGEIMHELGLAVQAKLIRVIDLLFVIKDKSGEVAIMELQDMPTEVIKAFRPYAEAISGLLTEEDAFEMSKLMNTNCSAGLLVIEQLWAKGFKQALMNADGILLAEGRVHAEALKANINELNALTEKAEKEK